MHFDSLYHIIIFWKCEHFTVFWFVRAHFHRAVMNNQRPKARSSESVPDDWWCGSLQWRMTPVVLSLLSQEKQNEWKGYRLHTYSLISSPFTSSNLDHSMMRYYEINPHPHLQINFVLKHFNVEIAYFCYAIKWCPLLTGCV